MELVKYKEVFDDFYKIRNGYNGRVIVLKSIKNGGKV